jgi:hypothetical protein
MKYIIALNVCEHFIPIVFDDSLVHAIVAKSLRVQKLSIKSAGFVYKHENGYAVSDDKSESMGIGPDKEYDEFILNAFLGEGWSGIDLNNLVHFAEIKGVL